MSESQKKPQRFCLRWNNFHSNIVSAFESLRKEEDFVDVTLACDGGSIKAHKMILSACSPYFKDLLKDNPCQHPIVILRDVSYCQLESLLQFVYHGEVNVSHDQLPEFLRTAEVLRIRGLADDKDSSGTPSPSSSHHKHHSNLPSPQPPSPSDKPKRFKSDKPALNTSQLADGTREQMEPENLSLGSGDKGRMPKLEKADDYEEDEDDNSLLDVDDEMNGKSAINSVFATGNLAKMVNMMQNYQQIAQGFNPSFGHFTSGSLIGRNITPTSPGNGVSNDSEAQRLLNQQRMRKPRTVFSPVQINILRTYFAQNQHPTSHEMQFLADKLFLQRGVVKVWFQNERAKMRRFINQTTPPGLGSLSSDQLNNTSNCNTSLSKHEGIGSDSESQAWHTVTPSGSHSNPPNHLTSSDEEDKKKDVVAT